MKKTIITTMLVALASICMASTNVPSVNIVGYSRVTIPDPAQASGLVMVGMGFDAFDQTLEGVLGTNHLHAASFYTSADKVIMWDTASQSYKSYAIKSSDMKFHDATSFSSWNGAPVNPPVPAGSCFWLQRYADATDSLDIVVMGEVVMVATQQVDIVTNLQMVAYPFSSDINIQNTDFTSSGAVAGSFYTSADQIIVWDKQTGTYKTYALKESDGLWHDATSFSTWNGPAVTNDLKLGSGFWYKSHGTGFVWTVTNAYINNL